MQLHSKKVICEEGLSHATGEIWMWSLLYNYTIACNRLVIPPGIAALLVE